jgi:hypothetical protein
LHRVITHSQLNRATGVTGDVLITIHPPNPELTQVPLRVSTGEPEQTVVLHGKHLERIEKITGAGADWKLSDMPKGAADLTERSATVKLASSAKKGDQLSMEIELVRVIGVVTYQILQCVGNNHLDQAGSR